MQATWENVLYNFVNTNVNPPPLNLINFFDPNSNQQTTQRLPFNAEQRTAVRYIANIIDQVPQRTNSPNSNRVSVVPLEQVRTYLETEFSTSQKVVASTLIIGPPGTGKTHLICSGAILRVLSPENLRRSHPQRVFIATFSNAGSYRIFEKFYQIANLAGTQNYYERIKLVQASSALDKFAFESLRRRLNLDPSLFTIPNYANDSDLVRENLIFVGTSDSLSILSQNNNDIVHSVIYDEASQLTMPQFFQVIPDNRIDSICVVGDDAQLPPVSKLMPLGISTLSYLQGTNTYQNSPIPVIRRLVLLRQYRMHPAIAQLTQGLVSSRRTVIPDGATINNDYLLPPENFDFSNLLNAYSGLNQTTIQALQNILRPEYPLVIVDTSNISDAIDERIGSSRRNIIEAQIAIGINKALVNAYSNLNVDDIILTAPYRRQVDYFKSYNIRAGTVHQFQGQEALIVIYSLTFASPGTKSDFFSQVELMYVGLSRAQRKLIILGNKNAINHPDPAVQTVRNAIFEFQYVSGGTGYPDYTINPVCRLTVDDTFLSDIINKII